MGIGYELIKDSVQRIDLAMGECAFTMDQLLALKKIFELSLAKTEAAIDRANNGTPKENDRS